MTSGVAKGLHMAGFPMAKTQADLIGASPDQPHGHYEDRRLVHINDEILRAHGGAWDSPPTKPWQTMYVQTAIDYIKSRGVPQWGMKDPRLVLTWPIWEPAFAEFDFDLIKVKVYRDVDNTVQSLYRRDGTRPGEATYLVRHYHEKLDNI